MKKPEMNPITLYKIAKFCFFTVGILALAGLFNSIKSLDGIEIIKQFAWIIFYFAFSSYFSYMQKSQEALVTDDKGMQEILNKLK